MLINISNTLKMKTVNCVCVCVFCVCVCVCRCAFNFMYVWVYMSLCIEASCQPQVPLLSLYPPCCLRQSRLLSWTSLLDWLTCQCPARNCLSASSELGLHMGSRKQTHLHMYRAGNKYFTHLSVVLILHFLSL